MTETVFISYGGPDEVEARTLSEYLRLHGAKTWFFPTDAVPGEKLHRTMWRGVNEYDRILALCSEDSLSRPGFLNELERVLEREAREGGESRLIPVSIDDSVFSHDWPPDGREDLREQILTRVITEIPRDHDDPRFETAMEKILQALDAKK